MNKPLVSAIMATYNRVDFIEDAINSVLRQDYPLLELIIVDDGSTDGTQKLLEDKYLSDSRIKYIYQENAGQMAATNKAISVSSGSYVAMIDSDNLWEPGKVREQVDIFNSNPDVDIVYGDIITIDEHGQECHRKNMQRYSGHISQYLLKDNFVTVNTAMIKKRCIQELGAMNTGVEVAGDYDMWLRFSTKFNFLYVPRFWARYRVMANQISSDKSRRFRNTEKMVLDFISDYPEATSSLQKRKGLAYFYVRKARYNLSVGQYINAYKSILLSLQKFPIYLPAYRALLKIIVTNFSSR